MMASIALQDQIEAVKPQPFSVAEKPFMVERLGDECEAEVLSFLSARPLHTVFLAGFIYDNGLESPANQGAFYALRNREGRLEGVALIGRVILFETDSEDALKAFARIAHGCDFTRVILGEQRKVERFWNYYSMAGQELRRKRRQLLFEQRLPIQTHEPVPGLRMAMPADLPLILPVTDKMIFEESGDRPLETDLEAFTRRWLQRIEQGRVIVWIEQDRLIFTADIICETPDVIYLEGVHVHPEERGKGYGLRCLSQIGRSLLKRSQSICLLAYENNTGAHAFYRAVGYKLRGYYDTLFLDRKN